VHSEADVFYEKPDEGNISLSSPWLEFIINFVCFRGDFRNFRTILEVSWRTNLCTLTLLMLTYLHLFFNEKRKNPGILKAACRKIITVANAMNICFERFHVWFLYYLGSDLIFLFHTVSWNLWNDHVLGWWNHKDDSNVLFLKYEDLQKVCWSGFCILSCSGLLVYSIEKHVPKHPRFLPFFCALSAFQAFNKVAECWGLSYHVPRGWDPMVNIKKWSKTLVGSQH